MKPGAGKWVFIALGSCIAGCFKSIWHMSIEKENIDSNSTVIHMSKGNILPVCNMNLFKSSFKMLESQPGQ